jgi:quercetin dioxygenase-like cupin family protein
MTPLWIRPGEGTRISPLGGDASYYKVIGDQTGGLFAMLEQKMPPGSGPRKHVHTREEESFYILDGEFGFEVGEESFVAKAGDFVLAPRNIPHRFWNAGSAVGRFLLIISPPGLEPFFMEYSELLAKFPGDLEKEANLAARYGLFFVP